MKYYLQIAQIATFLLFGIFQVGLGQPSANRNYVRTTIVKQSGVLHEALISALAIGYNSKGESISYFDGLGRPIQTVITKGGATQKDIISPIEYDSQGREVKKYLPYADITSAVYGSFKSDWNTKQPAFYNGQLTGVQTDAMAYSQTIVEASPLNRPFAQGSPGSVWQPNTADAYDVSKKTVKIKYETNLATDNVVLWNVASSATTWDISQITRNGYYANGLLNIKHIFDEHNNETKEYSDKEGHTILKRLQDNTGWTETYYIYDEFGRLRAVIQPEGVAALPATLTYAFANSWMFLYRYDERGRIAMKKVPGADSVVMMYDQWDRLVLTEDGVQRAKANKEWLFTKYDYLNRPIMTGIYINNSANNIIRDLISATSVRFENINSGVTEGYTLNLSFPSSYQELLTILHYDSYANLPSWKSAYTFVSENSTTTYTSFTNGLLIASQAKVIGTTTWLKTVNYYDEENRPIQVLGDNIKNGKDRITTQFLWDGKPVEQWQNHTSNFYSTAIVLKKKFTYDHADRILTVKHQVNSQAEVTIATNNYNEIGQLLSKKLHITAVKPTALQTLDYGYNIKGWLINVNRVENTAGITTYDPNDLFAFELNYNTTSLTGAVGQYNGNISEQKWKGPFAETPNGYAYGYDKLNRLLNAVVSDKAGASWIVNNKYDEKSISYDKNGNIKTLARYENGTAIDNLTYNTYSGNQLTKVEDAGDATLGFKNNVNTTTEYYYDLNGSLNRDDNKGISSIVYNYLNLPATITITGKGNINYLYDATGNKLRKITFDQLTSKYDTTWYAGAFVYAKDTLQLISFDEGRLRPVKINPNTAASASNFTYVYDYFLKDHLGNVRMVITTETKTIIYAATMEDASASAEDQLFSNVSTTKITKPVGFDAVGANLKVSKLNGDINTAGNKRTGPSIILKVMAGDTISLSTYAWYSGPVQAPPGGLGPIATELASLLTSGIVNNGGGKGGIFSPTVINGLSTTAVNNLLNTQTYNTSQPKAFLNWIVVDEQFAAVTTIANHLGAVQVPLINAGGTKQQLVGPVNMVVQKSGYLYAYVSNESNMNVYFDDLVINHKVGPVLEITNYFPFGLTIGGMSTKAAGNLENIFKFNDGTELNNSLNISLYETDFRLYDPQIGRFVQVDELANLDDNQSPYVFANNNPILLNDPQGLSADTAWKDNEEVVVKSKQPLDTKNGQVLKPQSMFFGYLFGQRSIPGHVKIGENYLSVNWSVNNKGYLTGGIEINRMELTIIPEMASVFSLKQIIKLKNLIKAQYVIYRGMKNGKLYIGKALLSLAKRYGSEERAGAIAARVIEGLDNVPDNMTALGIEQLVIELNGGIESGMLSNKMAATVKEVYINEARYWLDNNLENWEQVLNFK